MFRTELTCHGVAARGEHYIAPVLVGQDAQAVEAARRLQERGYDIRAIRPPSVREGSARLRISLHADHGPALLIDVAAAVAEVLRDLDCNPVVAR